MRGVRRNERATWGRPGWPEMLAALAAYVVLLVVVPPILLDLTADDAVTRGLALGALSGVLGLAAFFAAFAIRIRRWAPFGVVRASWRWLLLGLAGGVAALVVTRLVAVVLVLLGFDPGAADAQGDYRSAATGGPLALGLSVAFLAVLTPIGEEFAFRGVLTNALRRYGAWVSVLGSTLVFALAHGINIALLPAVVVGLIAAILFLRSGSVWPGVLAHAVNNGGGLLLTAALTTTVA